MHRSHLSHMRVLLGPPQHERRRPLSTSSVQKTSALSVSSDARIRTPEYFQTLGTFPGRALSYRRCHIATFPTWSQLSTNRSLRKTRVHTPINRSRSASAASATHIPPQSLKDEQAKLLFQRLSFCPRQRRSNPSERVRSSRMLSGLQARRKTL